MKIKRIILGLFFVGIMLSLAQSSMGQVTIGAEREPDKSAVLELTSSNKGLLLPRFSLTSTKIAAPLKENKHVAGMLVYNTNTNGSGDTAVTPGTYYNDGTQWIRVSDTDTKITLSNKYGIVLTNKGANKISVELPEGVNHGDELTWDHENKVWVSYLENLKIQYITDYVKGSGEIVDIDPDTDIVVVNSSVLGGDSGIGVRVRMPIDDQKVVLGKRVYFALYGRDSVTFFDKNGVAHGEQNVESYLISNFQTGFSTTTSGFLQYAGNGKWGMVSGY